MMLYDFDDKKTLSLVRNLLYVVLFLACLFTGVVVYWLPDILH